MEYVLNNGFHEMSEKEMDAVDGGLGFWAGLLLGAVIDGIVTNVTGQSMAEWVSDGINYVLSF